MDTLGTLNNREIALVFWVLVFLIWIVLRHETRISLRDVIKILLNKKILVPFVLMVFYVLGLIWIFSKLGWWRLDQTKDTIWWFFGTAILLFFNVDQATKEERYLRKIVLDGLKLLAVLQFIINLYAFSLPVEIVLVPILMVLVGMQVVAEREAIEVKKLLTFILSAYGLYLVYHALTIIVDDYQEFASAENIQAFILPFILTVAIMPFMYILALWMAYESLFVYLKIPERDKRLTRYAKRKILMMYRLNLGKLNHFANEHGRKLMKVRDRSNVIDLLEK